MVIFSFIFHFHCGTFCIKRLVYSKDKRINFVLSGPLKSAVLLSKLQLRPASLNINTLCTHTHIYIHTNTRHCPNITFPSHNRAHVVPTQPRTAIIFCLYPLPTHSHTNTLLTLFLLDKMNEVIPGKVIFCNQAWFIRLKQILGREIVNLKVYLPLN